MNRKQLATIAQKLELSDELTKTVALVILDGLSGYGAEKAVYGKATMTAKRAEKRVIAEFEYCQKVSEGK